MAFKSVLSIPNPCLQQFLTQSLDSCPFCVAIDMMEDPSNGDEAAVDAGSSTGKHVTIEYAAKVHGDNTFSMTGAW